jgi:2'-5' RNA ligase
MASEQPDHTGSAMIACYPPPDVAKALLVPDGLDPDGMHLTVAYVGKAADVSLPDLVAAAAELIARPPLDASVSGHARFTGNDKGDVIVALVESPALDLLRRDTVDALAKHGVGLPSAHGFTGHMTLLYLPPTEPSPVERINTNPVQFTALSVVHGDTRIDLPFTPPPTRDLDTAAREAYAAGWAGTGGPMTDRVKAGCAAAIRMVREHRHDPGVLELALQLGSLEGTWAQVYDRRDKLRAAHEAKAMAAWKTVITRGLIADAVADFERRIGPAESALGDRIQQITDAATTAVGKLLQALPATRAWQAIRAAFRNALAAGRAEGAVDAVAIAADKAGRVGLEWDGLFDHMYDALDDLGSLWSEADGWLGKMLGRAAADLGRSLAASARAGETYAQMLAGAMQVLDSDDVDAVSFVVDWAQSTALSQGALDLYRSESVTAISWMDAGDGRVCPTCESNAENGPYAPDDFPECPDHPRCRCCAAAAMDLAGFAQWFSDA